MAFAATAPAGVGNFYQVNENLYRGAQPTAEGFRNLAKMGIKTVIDLREFDSRSLEEKKQVEAAGMKYVGVPMHGAPTDEQMAQAMAVIHDQAAGPVFVHCKRGADRTGTVIACYRKTHDSWDSEKAIQEALHNGMHWFEFAMQRYVREYQAGTSVAAATAAAPAAIIQ